MHSMVEKVTSKMLFPITLKINMGIFMEKLWEGKEKKKEEKEKEAKKIFLFSHPEALFQLKT